MHRFGPTGKDFGRFVELLRCLLFAFGVDHPCPPFALGLGLLRHGPNHGFIDIDMLDLDVGNLDSPCVGVRVDNILNILVELVALGEQFIEFVLPKHGTQGRLRKLAGSVDELFDLDDRALGIDNAKIDDGRRR